MRRIAIFGTLTGGFVFLSLCYAVVRWAAQLAMRRFRSSDFKELEILVLRHELGILRRRVPRPAISWTDRLLLTAASRLLLFGALFWTRTSRTFKIVEVARPKEFDRDEALKSALGIFRKKGFSATSTDDLRLAMGIGRQSFYDTFKGKKAIYLEALRKYNSDRVLGYFEIFRKSDSPLKAIEDMLVSIALEHPQERMLACLGVASVCEFGTSDADVRSINDASTSAMQSVLEKLVTEAKVKRKIRSSLDPATTARYLQSTLAGMRVTARAGASPEALKAIATIAVDGLKSP